MTQEPLTEVEQETFWHIQRTGGIWTSGTLAPVANLSSERAVEVLKSLRDKGYLENVTPSTFMFRMKENPKKLRYAVHQSGGGTWYVYDTVKHQLTWVTPNQVLADELCADLNEVQRAVAKRQKKMSDTAVEEVRQLIRMYDASAVSHANLAQALSQQGATEAAVEEATDAREERRSAAALRELLAALNINPEED